MRCVGFCPLEARDKLELSLWLLVLNSEEVESI